MVALKTIENEDISPEEKKLHELFARHKDAYRAAPHPSRRERDHHLRRLYDVVLDRREEIADAVSEDFGHRSRHETLIADVFVTLEGIKYARKHLADWMKVEKRAINLLAQPAKAELRPQPLGVVGIISPWNYPVTLALGPLVAALAAGNRVMLKPSELTPKTSEVLASLCAEVFQPDHVSVPLGGVDVGVAFSRLPFDHLLYTGSTHVGRLVMKAAADNLTPVTLELGGKSPTIVHPDFDHRRAAGRIMFGKLFNAGQTCIAPDYVLVHEDRLHELLGLLKEAAARMYPRLVQNPDYTSIINERHHARLLGYLEDAEKKGARLIPINPGHESFEGAGTKLMPHLLADVSDEMTVMQDEIFGPLLPVVPYRRIDEAISFVNDRPRPLALYYFDDDKGRQDHLLERTVSGGVVINDVVLHFAQDDLPFGGVGDSGLGAYHGKEGFLTFSHLKPVVRQAKLNGVGAINPPYKSLDKLLKLILR